MEVSDFFHYIKIKKLTIRLFPYLRIFIHINLLYSLTISYNLAMRNTSHLYNLLLFQNLHLHIIHSQTYNTPTTIPNHHNYNYQQKSQKITLLTLIHYRWRILNAIVIFCYMHVIYSENSYLRHLDLYYLIDIKLDHS